MESENKAERILSIYSRLRQGKLIYKDDESIKYGVTARTIQRDIDDIKCFLQNQGTETGEVQEVIYDRDSGGYRLETRGQGHLNSKELLVICKVMLESRSLIKEEMFPIIHKLINSGDGGENRKLVKEYINNEMYHFIELQHGQKLLDRVWQLEGAIKEQRCIEIRYRKLKNKEQVVRKVKPVGIMFSEFYYYLTAYIENIDKDKEFQNPNDPFPTIYRVDRMEDLVVLNEHFAVPYSERFEEGEFRKRVQFMYGGRLRKIRFEYSGENLESVLDRLPTAIVENDLDGKFIIRAEVFGKGIEMWLRSQGEMVRILD